MSHSHAIFYGCCAQVDDQEGDKQVLAAILRLQRQITVKGKAGKQHKEVISLVQVPAFEIQCTS